MTDVLLQLLCVYAVYCWKCLLLASGTFLDFRLDTSDSNNLILECYDSETGTIDSRATIDFFAPGSAVPHMSLVTGQGSIGLPHTVTPANEALLRCTSSDGNQEDKLTAIAGIQCHNNMYTMLMSYSYTSTLQTRHYYSSTPTIHM